MNKLYKVLNSYFFIIQNNWYVDMKVDMSHHSPKNLENSTKWNEKWYFGFRLQKLVTKYTMLAWTVMDADPKE